MYSDFVVINYLDGAGDLMSIEPFYRSGVFSFH